MRRRRRPTLHHAVKDKRVTVLGPVKQPEMDFMSHRGIEVCHFLQLFTNSHFLAIFRNLSANVFCLSPLRAGWCPVCPLCRSVAP